MEDPHPLTEELAVNRLYALVELHVRRRYAPTELLSAVERLQLHFWEAMYGKPMDNALVFFGINRVVPLKLADGSYPTLLDIQARRRRGNFVELNDVEVAQCCREGIVVEQICRVCLRVPAPYAVLVATERWSAIGLPDDPAQLAALNVPWNVWALASPPQHVLYGGDRHNPVAYQDVADALRLAFASATGNDERARLAELVRTTQAIANDANPDLYRRRVLFSGVGNDMRHARYDGMYTLKVFLIMSHLKASRMLPLIFRDVAELLFTDVTMQQLDALIEEASKLSMSPATISRAKVLFDGAFMLWTRRWNEQMLTEGGCSRYFMADSSMQHSREFEAVWLLTVRNSDLVTGLRAANELIGLSKELDEEGIQGTLEDDERLTEALRSILWNRQPLPPLGLGSGQGALKDKFHTVMSDFFLIGAGCSAETRVPVYRQFLESMVAGTGDMGVEFGLPCVQPIPVNRLFPWVELPPVGQINEEDEWGFDFGQDAVTVSMPNALQVAGIQHVIHNAARDMLGVCEYLASHVTGVTAIAKLLRTKALRKRLQDTCYSTAVGEAMFGELLGVRCCVYIHRWSSFAMAAEDVLARRHALCWGWDVDKYMKKEKKPNVHMTEIEAAVSDPAFWFSLAVVDLLHFIAQEVSRWARGCPCHSDYITKETPNATKARWRKCVLCSFRYPELCAGDLLSFVRNLIKLQGVSHILESSKGIEDHVREKVIAEFYKGQAHILSTLSIKLGPYMSVPLVLGATAHHDQTKARSAVEKCLRSSCNHPRILELQSQPLREQAELFVQEWATLDECPDLLRFTAQFKFVPIDETVVESLHAMLEKTMSHITNRALSTDSLQMRMPYFKILLAKFDNCKADIAALLTEVHSPGKLARRLGMHDHTSAPTKREAWSTAWRDLIYRSDGPTLRGCGIPEIEVRSYGDTDGPPPLDAVPRNPGSVYGRLLWLAAVERVLDRARALGTEYTSKSQPLFISCKVGSAAIASISGMFGMSSENHDMAWLVDAEQGECKLSDAAAGPWVAQQARNGILIFSVLPMSLSKLHRVRKGKLCRTDLSVTVHRILRVKTSERRLLIGACPVNIDALVASETYVPGASLVLSLASLDLEALQSMRFFSLKEEVALTAILDLSSLEGVPECATESVIDTVAQHLAFGKEIPGDVSASADSVLEWLRSKDLLDGARLTKNASDKMLFEGWWVQRAGNVLNTDPDVPVPERSRYQLMGDLEEAGWQFRIATKRKRLGLPYKAAEESQKEWWLLAAKHADFSDATIVVRPYLMCLLLAAQHGREVPHAAQTQDVYWRIMDPEWEPKVRRVRRVQEYRDDDEWAVDVVVQQPRRQKRKRAQRAPRVRDSSSEGGEEPDPAPKSDSSSGSSSSSSSSTSPSAAKSSHASGQSGSSSSDTGNAEASEAPPQPKAKAKAKARAKSSIERSGRLNQSRVPYGACWLTPRYDKGSGDLVGWFMLCTNPEHMKEGQRCSKECSAKRAGGDIDHAQRLLKAWVAFASESTTGKVEHYECFEQILKMGDMLRDLDLDALAPTEWRGALNLDGGEASLSHSPAVSQRVSKKRGRSEDVPNAIHELAQSMWASGELRETTEDQRKRNRMTSGTDYRTPPRYTALLRHGYLGLILKLLRTTAQDTHATNIKGPNLPPPIGHRWLYCPGRWILAEKGG